MLDPQEPLAPTAREPGPDPKTLSMAAGLMAAEEDWTVFRRFDEFNLINLLMLQDEIQKLGKEFKDSCWERSDNTSAADSLWYTPPNPLASGNAFAMDGEGGNSRAERRRQLWGRLKNKLKEYNVEQVKRLREELARMGAQSRFPNESVDCWDSVYDDDLAVLRSGVGKGSRVSNWIKLGIGILQWEFGARKKAWTTPGKPDEPRVIVVGKKQLPMSKAEMAKKHASVSRFIMALFGGFALIVPTVIMAKVKGINVSLITTSVAVFMFGLILAFTATGSTGKDVLAATAAYTAVLVVKDGSSGDDAVRSYDLYETDIKWLCKYKATGYRFSLACLRRLLRWHLNKDAFTPDFIRYARVCFERFGDRVKNWITYNESGVYSLAGYAAGVHAPARYSFRDRNEEGDSKAMRCFLSVFVVLTMHGSWSEPRDTDDPKDQEAAQRVREFDDSWCENPLYKTSANPDSMRAQDI
ncbi:putative beta-glucosidase [Fusarium austroafricanum]|uniref:Putative beta-glucosidase n=1 Tax=Fusarium austroafricanum TaxID=2364996 RepID=A0A8H4KT79_9HYPO|nr:putative beta-glucosidase [Fusarium austroafricanum]